MAVGRSARKGAMNRYAVLLDLDDEDLRPIALVTEHDREVLVHFAVDCGLKSRYTDAYRVTEPDGTMLEYTPGNVEYFNSVINTLSRGFVLNELDTAGGVLDNAKIIELYTNKVVLPRTRKTVAYAASQSTMNYVAGDDAGDADTVTATTSWDGESMLATAA